MITIKPETNTSDITKLLEIDNKTYVYMAAKDKDELLGGGVATPEGEILEVKSIMPVLNDGIIKSFINFFDRREIKDLFSRNENIFGDLKKVGFKESEGKLVINTDKFFGKPCSGDKN